MRIAQDQQYEGQDWWTWSVWIEAPEAELEKVEKVVWHLHPTFPEPDRTQTNRADKFLLKTAGWGTFRLRADVIMASGETVRLHHDLQLYYPDQKPPPLRGGD